MTTESECIKEGSVLFGRLLKSFKLHRDDSLLRTLGRKPKLSLDVSEIQKHLTCHWIACQMIHNQFKYEFTKAKNL